MKTSCRSVRATSGVAAVPPIVSPSRAACTFAGNIATSSRASASAASRAVRGTSSAAAPTQLGDPGQRDEQLRVAERGRDHGDEVRAAAPEVRGSREEEHGRDREAAGEHVVAEGANAERPGDAEDEEGSDEYDERCHGGRMAGGPWPEHTGEVRWLWEQHDRVVAGQNASRVPIATLKTSVGPSAPVLPSQWARPRSSATTST